MIWIALSVPLMALGVAVAVVPVVWGSVRHHRAEMVQELSGVAVVPSTAAPAPGPAAPLATIAPLGPGAHGAGPTETRPTGEPTGTLPANSEPAEPRPTAA